VDNPVAEVKLKTASPSKAMVRVVDDQDNPIQGIGLSVVLVGRKEHRFSSGSVTSWSGSLLTDANGEAELTPLHPTWEYSVTANARTGFVKDTAELVQGKTAVIQLKTGQVIKGKLIDKDGNPVSNREITAKIDDDRYSYRRIRADHNTDSNGRFEFTRLPQGLLQIGTFGADDVLVDAGTDKDPIQLQLNE